ncbi:MAG TPA: hypothetical protein VNO43_00735 [Candidatus Eisenbacteria bacterium]|nr:hypothetical protein [Candidatus Eisenbacteria bacterium]
MRLSRRWPILPYGFVRRVWPQFPTPAVKLLNRQRLQIDFLQAADVDHVFGWIRPWPVKGRKSAVPTK